MSETKKNQTSGRRRFLQICLCTSVSGLASGVFYPLFKYLAPRQNSLKGNIGIKIPLATLQDKKQLSILMHHKPVIILADKDTFRIFSAVCSHLGCAVTWKAETEEFICPCHSARFDKDGQVLSGPPRQRYLPIPPP